MTIYLARQDGAFPTDAIKRRFIRWLYLAGIALTAVTSARRQIGSLVAASAMF